jgi:hypothetical protein
LGNRNPSEPEELWSQDLKTGVAERALPGIAIANSYDISPDGTQVVFDSLDDKGQPHIWIAPLDRRQPPRRLESTNPERYPLFASDGALYLQVEIEGRPFLYRRSVSTSDRQQVVDHPIVRIHTISPDGKWIVAEAAVTGDEATRSVYAYNTTDGTAKRLCYNLCGFLWSLDGKYLYLSLVGPGGSAGSYKTFAIPLRRSQMFPDLPPNGIQSERDLDHMPKAGVIGENVYPGPDGSRWALSRWTVHRNIFSIPIP